MNRKIALGVSLPIFAFCAAPQAQAQDNAAENSVAAGDEGLGAIIVTAQRRAEDVQRAAVAITAVTGEELQQRSVTQTEQLASLSASLQVSTSAGPYASFSVRSVNSLSGNAFADPAVAVNVNGVYLATPTVLHGLYFDLDRVEILKGPQGTLYGRNATAGAINIIPARPRFENEGRVNVEVGSFDRFNIGGALNLALADSAALRIAGQRVRRDGYMSDGTSDDVGEAVRASFLVEPTPDLSILVSADYAHQGGRGPGATIRERCELVGGPAGEACFVADPYTGIADLAALYTAAGQAVPTRNQFIDGDYWGLALNADLTTGIGTFSFVGVQFLCGHRHELATAREAEAGTIFRRIAARLQWRGAAAVYFRRLLSRYEHERPGAERKCDPEIVQRFLYRADRLDLGGFRPADLFPYAGPAAGRGRSLHL